MKSAIEPEDLEIFKMKHVAVTVPHYFEDNRNFTYFGRLVRVTEGSILLYRDGGFYSYEIKNIIRINEAKPPKGVVQ